MTDDSEISLKRIMYKGKISALIVRICESYPIGTIQNYSIIETGFEDCNILINTTKGKYIAKIFSKIRTSDNIKRYSEIIDIVTQAGIHHPKLLKTNIGNTIYSEHNLNLVLLEYIEGKNYFELHRSPNLDELRLVLKEAAKINLIDFKPSCVFDTWAIPNIVKIYEETKKFINKEDIILIEKAIGKYNSIPINKLPYCFVHGDFTKANIVKGNDNNIYILDFSVSNWYPRIQELAVIAANLTHDNSLTLKERCEIISREYSKFNQLTAEEIKGLYSYAIAGAAMEFLGAHREKYIEGNDTKEADYWLELGRNTLKQALGK